MLKIQLPKLLITLFLVLFFAGKARAVYTFTWKGTTSTAWTTSTNWTRSGSGDGHGYPGQTAAVTTDIVQIGTTTFTNNRNPVLATSLKVASIEFGNNDANDMSLTVNGATLTVVGNISQDFIPGYINFIFPISQSLTTTLAGTGTIICQNFLVGDTTQPTIFTNNLTKVSSQINQLTINGNLVLNAEGDNNYIIFLGYFDVNYPEFSVDNNNLLLKGQIITTSDNNPSSALSGLSGIGLFTADNNSNNTRIELPNANPIATPIESGFSINFTGGGSGSGTVLYDNASGTQTVYTTATSGLGNNNNYDNLTLSGASAKTILGGTLSITSDWTTSGGAINMNSNNTVVTVGDDWTNSAVITQGFGNISITDDLINSGTLNLGTGSLTIAGNYTNSGTYIQSTGNTVFNGMSQVLTDNGTGTAFKNVIFNGNGGSSQPDILSSGNFSVSSSSILTMANATYLNANGHLTLNSDVNSSATVAAIPSGANITGNVNVQRFIQGSTDQTKRGYRLVSSTVYTATVGGINLFDLKYLNTSVYTSGLNGTANGFSASPLNNPSLYLFREDIKPPASNSVLFTTAYNWKGISNMNNTNAYDIGTQKKMTTTNLADTTVNIPVGNGVLFFFRGDNVHNTVHKTTTPFSAPEDVTTTQVGKLNTGTVNVKLWFANALGLGNKLSYTSAWVNSGTASLRGGFNFVGNPYASTINWEKYNRNGTNSSIYGTVSTTIWVFNEASKQYESYIQKASVTSVADTTTTVNIGTGSASNMIASGQGFFVKATAAGQTLSFRETAKTSTQPTAARLHDLMGKPKEFVEAPAPLLRLKLQKDSINTDEIVIRISDKASTKFVVNEDAEDMGGNGALESLSAFSSDSVALAIDFVPFPGKQQEIIPLYTDATESGTYKLINTQLANLPPLYEIWLKDSFTNDSLKLEPNAAEQFTIDKNNPATFGSSRFTVVIRQNPAYAYQLLDFTATKVATARQVQLVWKTQNEQNYTNFTVERSTDGGKTFDVIGGMQGTDAGTYSLLDKNPIVGQNLYRLRQEDKDDSITYSKVIPVQYTDLSNNVADKVRVYPNPAISTINVAIASDVATKPPYTIQITNSSGLLIKQVNSAQADWQSSIARLLPGTYIVKVHNSTDNSFVGDSKFVKL